MKKNIFNLKEKIKGHIRARKFISVKGMGELLKVLPDNSPCTNRDDCTTQNNVGSCLNTGKC